MASFEARTVFGQRPIPALPMLGKSAFQEASWAGCGLPKRPTFIENPPVFHAFLQRWSRCFRRPFHTSTFFHRQARRPRRGCGLKLPYQACLEGQKLALLDVWRPCLPLYDAGLAAHGAGL
jgi:hypothetical protein